MKIYSDSTVSAFLQSVTEDQNAGFLNEWNGSRNHREKIYIDAVNQQIEAAEAEVIKAKKKYDEATDKLKSLLDKKKAKYSCALFEDTQLYFFGGSRFCGQLVIVQAVLFLLIFESHQLDTFCAFDDTFPTAFEISLILLTDTMIMLEVEDQQDT